MCGARLRLERMSFDRTQVSDLLARCRRRCCICGRFCGVKIETDHMDPNGGDDIENAIPVCFDCHAEIHGYNDQHPRGRKFTLGELRRHKQQWLDLFAQRPEALIEKTMSAAVGPLQALIDEIEFNVAAAEAGAQSSSGCRLRDEQFSELIRTGSLSLLLPDLKAAIIAAYVAAGHASIIGQAAVTKKAGGMGSSLSGSGASDATNAFANCGRLLSEARVQLLRFLGHEDSQDGARDFA